jgi:HEPN domain-containing protein
MNPLSIPSVRRVLHEISIEASRQIARQALTLVTAYEVHRYLIGAVSKLIKWDLASYANEIAPPDRRSEKR